MLSHLLAEPASAVLEHLPQELSGIHPPRSNCKTAVLSAPFSDTALSD